jgi:phosphatidylglycerol:prolipoprotein diacylglycerol transferase
MHPLLFKIGPLTLHTYGLMVAIGFLAAFYVAKREFVRRGLPGDFLDNVILPLMAASLLGARFVYFAVNGFHDLWAAPLSFFRIWEGGLVFYGGFIFGFLFLVFYARRRNAPFMAVTDALAAPLLLGQAFGRLGCFSAGCCYGRPTSSFLGVVFTNPDTLAPRFVALHPTQLYSAAGDLLLFAGLYLFRSKLLSRGAATAYYLIGYGMGRFLIEFIRNDDRGFVFLHLTPSQWISFVMIGLGLFIYEKRNTAR